MRAPGQHLRRLAAWLCDERTMSRVIDPAVADLQHEYKEAWRAGNGGSRSLLASYAGTWKVLAYCAARSLLRGVPAWFRSDRSLVGRTVRLASAVGLAITVLLSLPPLLARPPHADQAN
jgi:hypothetical protein